MPTTLNSSPEPLKFLEKGELSHKTNTCGPTAPEMEMTHILDALIVSYARGGKESSPSDLGPNRENYQIHTCLYLNEQKDFKDEL